MSFWRDLNGVLNDVASVGAPILGLALGGPAGAAAGGLVSSIIGSGRADDTGTTTTGTVSNLTTTSGQTATVTTGTRSGQTETTSQSWFMKNIIYIGSGVGALLVGTIIYLIIKKK